MVKEEFVQYRCNDFGAAPGIAGLRHLDLLPMGCMGPAFHVIKLARGVVGINLVKSHFLCRKENLEFNCF